VSLTGSGPVLRSTRMKRIFLAELSSFGYSIGGTQQSPWIALQGSHDTIDVASALTARSTNRFAASLLSASKGSNALLSD
jgi:hypothetical protein